LILGTPGPKLLGVLGTPGTFDDQIWPIIADDETTAARGGRLLTPQQRAAIERPGQTGADLLKSIAPEQELRANHVQAKLARTRPRQHPLQGSRELARAGAAPQDPGARRLRGPRG